MDNNAVAIAAIGALGSTVAIVGWVVKKVLSDIAPALQRHTEAADGLKSVVDKNTQSTDEMLTFMKKLNGKLPKLVEEKQKQARDE